VRISLPSGAWIEVRDNDKPSDRWAVADAPDVVNIDGQVSVRNAQGNMGKTYYARVILAWSYEAPFSPENLELFGDEWPGDMDDFLALEDALQERFSRVSRSRRSPNPQRPPSPTNATSPA
jgi:hypothetical protein